MRIRSINDQGIDSNTVLFFFFSLFPLLVIMIPCRVFRCFLFTTHPLRDTCSRLPLDELFLVQLALYTDERQLSQLMRLWYLSQMRPVKAQASLRIRAVSLEPSLFAHIKYVSGQSVRQKIRHLAPLDGCACAFEE